jgi:hypothetical protein
MALGPRRPAAIVRRVTLSSLAVDVGAGLFLGIIIGATIGWIVFFIGLVITAFVYYNFSRALKTRGLR